MKILITGAAGQIGSGLSKLLIENGHDLTLVDNLRNGYLENLKDEANEVIAPFYEVDITSGDFFLKCGDQYDVIIHLAAITSLPDCESNPLETLRINVSGTANVLEFCKRVLMYHMLYLPVLVQSMKNTIQSVYRGFRGQSKTILLTI